MDDNNNDPPLKYQKSIHKPKLALKELKKKEPSKEYIIQLLSKPRTTRTRIDNKILTDYLSSNVAFFTKLKDSEDLAKLDKLIGVLNYEFYPKGNNIISFGEEGDKFYILIEGVVGIFKPAYVNKTMKLKHYLDLMSNYKDVQGNMLKYSRTKEKNGPRIDLDFFMKINPESYALKKDYTVVIEEDEKLGEFTEPFAFGDIALIKRCQRNATIRALKDSKVVSIDKYDYNKIVRELEEKKLEAQLKDFRKTYPFFQYWNLNQLLKLYNCFSKQILNKGDYLYKQNEVSDSIYVIKSGVFEMYSLLSFGWLNEFFDYIITPKQNLIYSFDQTKMPIKETELMSYYENLIKESKDSPCVFNRLKVPKAIPSNNDKEEIDKLSSDHEEMRNPFTLFKVNCRKIDSKEVIGIEDALEIKKRFCFVKCVSKQAEVERINIYDFLKLTQYNRDDNARDFLLDMIAKRKLLIFTQLKNAALHRNKELCIKLSHRFHNLTDIKPTEETKLVVMKLKDKNLFDYENYKRDIIDSLTSSSKKKRITQKSHLSLMESSSSYNINYKHEHDQKIPALRNKLSRNLSCLNKKAYSLLRESRKVLPRMQTFHYSPFVCIDRFNTLVNQLSKERGASTGIHDETQNRQASITRDIENNSTTRPMENTISSLPRNNLLFKYFDNKDKDNNSNNKQIDEIVDLKQSLSRNNKQLFLSRDYNSSSQRVFKRKSKLCL